MKEYAETAQLLPSAGARRPAASNRRICTASRRRVCTAAALLALAAVAALLVLVPLPLDSSASARPARVGRFLHITDLHVDPAYLEGATTYSQCHRRPPHIAPPDYDPAKDGHRRTGRFGIPQAKCDSPVALVNATAEHLRREWAPRLDFAVWTGDSGRHDGDAEQPRTFTQIVEGNVIAAGALQRALGGIPIVPNIGNNDISPHNELAAPGHKRARMTFKALAKAWRPLIPDAQLATFRYGGYFAKDVVDYGAGGGITALSLNTIYWYRANAKVGGCRAKDSPGLAQLAWMRYQLRRARRRGRDVILLGHVLPSRLNYRPSCYHGYARTVTQVAPIPGGNATGDSDELPAVHAQLFGHSNVDVWAFVGQEAQWISSRTPLPGIDPAEDESTDPRTWWEREVDEESGRFGKLIRNVWSADPDEASDASAQAEQRWEDMADDPPVRFAEAPDTGHVVPIVAAHPVANATASFGLPSDFVEALLKEFKRVLIQDPQNPRLGVTTISPSIIPKYLPAFRVFKYLKESPSAPSHKWWHLPRGTLLDYDVFTAPLAKLNKQAAVDFSRFFGRLYRASEVYGIDDLSIDSYLKWAERLLSSKSLRKKFRSLTYLGTQ
ncbi:Endopolyphosphatase [Coemansia sp. RSA 2610]|nr:Endopolyphosphatase [Coemansia sp. RSA 2610]